MEMKIDYFRAVSRGITGDPWFYNVMRLAIIQYIEESIDRYNDFIITDTADYITKIPRKVVWGRIEKFKHLLKFIVLM